MNKNACTLKAFIMTKAFKTINSASKKKSGGNIEMNELGKDANGGDKVIVLRGRDFIA